VLLREGAAEIGGGLRSAELTLPGFTHDICAAIMPLAVGSPFFRHLPLAEHGLAWVQPPTPLAHPLDDGSAAVLERSITATAAGLGRDGAAYRRLMQPLVDDWDRGLADGVLGPLRVPSNPLAMARLALVALRSARGLAEQRFQDEPARALLAGMAAHSMLPLERPMSAAAGLITGLLGHVVGWPLARGGSHTVATALAAYLRSLGGEIVTGAPVDDLDDLPPHRGALLNLAPRHVLRLAGDRLPVWYTRSLRHYRYGLGVFKVDWALDGPIPWRAAACARAGTVHVGGTLAEIAAGERAAWCGVAPERPLLILAQQSLFDPTRAPAGRHTVWAYCHVPAGCTVDMTERMEQQIERFAPGFRDRILARHSMSPAAMEAHNPNYVGGDINSGVQDLFQHFTRPAPRLTPYATPDPRLFICSSATPPGGGVHGMCGYFAARAALRRLLR
jgi:phytoene dehydrogenase-like protein